MKKTIGIKDVSAEKFLDTIFMLVTVVILLSIMWNDDKDVFGYYQNLLIASFSVAITILHICHDIGALEDKGVDIPDSIKYIYKSCVVSVSICCVASLSVYIMAGGSKKVYNHLYNNAYWGICLITAILMIYTVFWGYMYPMIVGPPKKRSKIKYAERESGNIIR